MKRAICLFAVVLLLFFAGGSTAPVQSTDRDDISATEITAESTAPETTDGSETVTDSETTAESTETEIITETEAPMESEPVTDAMPPETTLPPETEPLPPVEDVIESYFGSQIPVSDITTIPLSPADRGIDPAKPMIALTFDDGPGAHTERLLDIFKEHGGKGTFFVVGNSIGGREGILARTAAEGHEIGIHTWWHSQLPKLTDVAIVDEIMMTRARIYAVTGVDTRIVRPPYGAIDERVKALGARLGVCFVNWSVDTLDWRTRDAAAVHDAVVRGAHHGAIILCHDLHSTTVDAMATAIPKLIADGYQLVTVSELLSFRLAALEPGRVYSR